MLHFGYFENMPHFEIISACFFYFQYLEISMAFLHFHYKFIDLSYLKFLFRFNNAQAYISILKEFIQYLAVFFGSL